MVALLHLNATMFIDSESYVPMDGFLPYKDAILSFFHDC